MISRTSKISVRYGQVEEDLRRRILSGEYPGGSALPGELLLCDAYGVSRKTIRKALENLRTQNYIRKHQGSGNFVIPEQERAALPRCTGKICIMLPQDSRGNAFAGELMAGIYKTASTASVSIFTLPLDTPVSVLLEMYYNFESDAFIWGALPGELPEAIAELSRRRIPQVVVNHKAPGCGSVLYNSYPAWCALMNTFSSAGHRRVVFIDRGDHRFWTLKRQTDFLAAAREYGLQPSVLKMDSSNAEMLSRHIRKNPLDTAYAVIYPFTGIFLEAVRSTGKKLPHDISWAEFTSGDIAGSPAIARIHTPAQKMGCEAVRLLLEKKFTENPAPEVLVPCFAVMGLSVSVCKKM